MIRVCNKVACWTAFWINALLAQRFVTDTLVISFYSDAPLEKISAENRTGCYSYVDLGTDSVYVRVRIRGFSFPNKLMEEHFNENYLESDKYPYAYFWGRLVAPFPSDEPGTYAVSAAGQLTIHGVTREALISGVFTVESAGSLRLEGKFFVRPADFNITIPKLLWQKIAETVEVSFLGTYRPKSR